ncbi:MAG: DNA translocase FtsK [Erysipelotrichaceae bacterium]|nr:DNA translocase FtsK [Erysipelotrichaceae bacterium]
MKEKMKSPKTRDNKILGDDVEYVLIGLMIVLLSIIGLLNKGPVGNFLTYITIYLFGAYYFILYAILLVLAFYLMFKKKVFKVKINMNLFGAILVFISLLIASSNTNSELNFNNLVQLFNEHMGSVSSGVFVIDNLSNLASTGGGFIGFTLKALLNTCVTNVGTTIIYIICMTVGLVLLFKDIIAYIVKFFVNYSYKIKERKEEKKLEEIKLSESESTPLIEKIVEENHDNEIEKVEETSTIEKEEKIPLGKPIIEELVIPTKPVNVKSFFIDDIEELPKNEVKDVKPIEVDDLVPPQEEVKEEPKSYFSDELLKPNYNNTLINEVNDIRPIEEKIPEEKKIEVVKPIIVQEKAQNIVKTRESTPKIEKKKPYQLPPFSLLKIHATEDTKYENQRIAQQRLEKINNTFSQYKIGAQVISYTIGPSVTRFNVKMNEGVRVNTLASVSNEISIALNGNKTVRIEMVVEGRDTSSIEVGNEKPTGVSFRECFEQIKDKTSDKDKLLIPLGKDIEGRVVTTSMDELPHLLVAGTTGSGKSVFVNTIISTFIMRNTPDELKLMLIDPKKVEFSKYANLPHLLCPIITDAKEGKEALKRLVQEMERRYELLSERGAAKISEYNEFAEIQGFEKMSNIVLVCDEFSDFMSEYGKEIEQSVKRLAQKARACGIYLIICTQRPSVNVITGDIKAVIPSRVGLLVPQYVDSKTILDEGGAESLLGNGDMLCRIPRHNSLVRVQGAFISGVEIVQITQFIKDQVEVKYDENFLNLVPQQTVLFHGNGERRKELDELHEECKAHVIRTRIASTSNLQSNFGIGYARADHILNCLEDEGVVKRVNGNRRIVVATSSEVDENSEN